MLGDAERRGGWQGLGLECCDQRAMNVIRDRVSGLGRAFVYGRQIEGTGSGVGGVGGGGVRGEGAAVG